MRRTVSQSSARAQALNHLAVEINRQIDLDSIYKAASQGFARALGVETAFVAVYDERSQSFRLASVFRDGDWLPVTQYPGFIASAFETYIPKDGLPYVLSASQVREQLAEDAVSSSLNLPAVILLAILDNQRAKIGFIGAGANDHERIFSPDEIYFAQVFASQLTSAITRAHLSAAVKEQALFLQLANAITRITLDNADLEKTLDLLAKQVVDILPVESCSISLWDQRKNVFSPRAAAGPNKSTLMSSAQMSEETSILKSVLQTGQARLFQGRQPLPETSEETGRFANTRLVLPMQNGARKIGVILIENPNISGAFDLIKGRTASLGRDILSDYAGDHQYPFDRTGNKTPPGSRAASTSNHHDRYQPGSSGGAQPDLDQSEKSCAI